MNTPRQPGDSDTGLTGRADDHLGATSGDRSDGLADTLILPPARRSGRWRTRWPLLLVLAWATSGLVSIMLFGVGSSAPKVGATKATSTPRITATHPLPSTAASIPSPSVQPNLAAQALVPIGVSAYGPTGPASGDNPSHAVDAIDGSTATAWETDWYRSAAFGGLQSGTGLLIDMGRPVTITSVTITLGAIPGVDLELLTGKAAGQSQMRTEARVSDAAGRVTMTMARPEFARYLLIWFTLLPPDSTGTYQAAVHDVRIEGTP